MTDQIQNGIFHLRQNNISSLCSEGLQESTDLISKEPSQNLARVKSQSQLAHSTHCLSDSEEKDLLTPLKETLLVVEPKGTTTFSQKEEKQLSSPPKISSEGSVSGSRKKTPDLLTEALQSSLTIRWAYYFSLLGGEDERAWFSEMLVNRQKLISQQTYFHRSIWLWELLAFTGLCWRYIIERLSELFNVLPKN